MTTQKPFKILCVDDDELFLSSLARLIQTIESVSVETATNAEDARERIASDHFAILVTDYRMPGESGIDLLEFLSQEHPEIVPVLTTAYMELDVALEAINRGHIFAFIRKPPNDDDVVLTVSRAIERYKLRQALRDKITELERTNRLLSESRNEVQRLHEVASTDQKTGVRSYSFFTDRLEEEIARAHRYEQPLTLVLIDLDGFKAVNDTLGHVVGDEVLREVAALMQSNIRRIDVLARFGGDEFSLLLPNTNIAGAKIVCERLRAFVQHNTFSSTEAGRITLSMGLCGLPDHPIQEGTAMIKLSDDALYQAKKAGGNCVSVAPTRE